MNRKQVQLLLRVIDTKIALALETDNGRDTTNEYLADIETQREFWNEFDGSDPTPAQPVQVAPIQTLLDKIPEGWFLQALAHEHTTILFRGDVHEPTGTWICTLQHFKGGRLITETGSNAPSAIAAAYAEACRRNQQYGA